MTRGCVVGKAEVDDPRWRLGISRPMQRGSGRNAGPGLAVGIGAAPVERRYEAGGGRVLHDGVEGRLEGFHFRLGADGDADVSRPDGPRTSDIDIARG